jgi:hypothetical protein
MAAELSAYDALRPIRKLPEVAEGTKIEIPSNQLAEMVTCNVCLTLCQQTMASRSCLHRFCGECIDLSIRHGSKVCPVCKAAVPAKRHLREDPAFDDVIFAFFGDIAEYEERESAAAQATAKTMQTNVIQQSIHAGLAAQEAARSGTAAASVLQPRATRVRVTHTGESVSSADLADTGAAKRTDDLLQLPPVDVGALLEGSTGVEGELDAEIEAALAFAISSSYDGRRYRQRAHHRLVPLSKMDRIVRRRMEERKARRVAASSAALVRGEMERREVRWLVTTMVGRETAVVGGDAPTNVSPNLAPVVRALRDAPGVPRLVLVRLAATPATAPLLGSLAGRPFVSPGSTTIGQLKAYILSAAASPCPPHKSLVLSLASPFSPTPLTLDSPLTLSRTLAQYWNVPLDFEITVYLQQSL